MTPEWMVRTFDTITKMNRIYAEVGFGNKTFFSTEFEENDKESRITKFVIPKHVDDVYLRLWVFKKNLIFSIKDGVKIKEKDKACFKILFGVGGYN